MKEVNEPLDLEERFEIRRMIHQSGRKIYESIEDRDLRYLVGDIMARNEDWVLNHKETIAAEAILQQGFTDTQLNFIKNIQNKLQRIKSVQRLLDD